MRHHVDSVLEKPGDAVFRQSFVWEEREKEMEREKGVDDGFCLSTDPAKRRLGAPTTTMVARMVVLKGSVDRHSQSRSQDHPDVLPLGEMSRSSLNPSLHFPRELLRSGTLRWAQSRLLNPLPAPLARSERVHATEQQTDGEGGASSRGASEGSWRAVGAPKGTRSLVEPQQPRPAPCRTLRTAPR